MTREQYTRKLESLNYPVIGKGMFANVFAIPHKPDKVVKVASLDNWPTYIKWATQNGFAGKFAPKVESLTFYDGFYVAVMERLVATMHDLGPSNSDQKEFYRQLNWNTDTRKGATKLARFWKKLQDHGLSGDLHPGNVMVRKDGQIVITDPTSRPFSSKKFKIRRGKIIAKP